MSLVQQQLVNRAFAVELTSNPAAIIAGRPARLTLRVVHPETGETVRRFLTAHERLFHLFIVSQDLDHFEHAHPQLQTDGSLTLDVTVPRPGLYQLYCDFVPEEGSPQLIQRTLMTAGSAWDPALTRAALKPQLDDVETAGMRVRLQIPASGGLVAGELQAFRVHVYDASTAQPVTDLQPFLGAPAHALIVTEDMTDAVHSHPALEYSSATGPDIVFGAVFPRAAMYRIWVQLQREGRVGVASFTVPVISARGR